MAGDEFLNYSKEVYRAFEVSEQFDPRRGIFDMANTYKFAGESMSFNTYDNYLESCFFFTRSDYFKDTKDCNIVEFLEIIKKDRIFISSNDAYTARIENFFNDDRLLPVLENINKFYSFFISSYTQKPLSSEDESTLRDGTKEKYTETSISYPKHIIMKYKIDYKTSKNVDDKLLDYPLGEIEMFPIDKRFQEIKIGFRFLSKCYYNNIERFHMFSFKQQKILNNAIDPYLQFYNSMTSQGLTTLTEKEYDFLNNILTLLRSFIFKKNSAYDEEEEIRIALMLPKVSSQDKFRLIEQRNKGNKQKDALFNIEYQGTVDNLTTPAHLEIIKNNKRT